MAADLTERQRRILGRLVSEYIEQGEPVSSAWLAQHSALGVSSATVRSILARLEEHGLVSQPHTSAGRVPTDSGYRLYVDWLLESRKRPRPSPEMEARWRRHGTVGDLLENASQELSRASHHIGFALAPPALSAKLRHVDFAALDGHRVLVIVVATGGVVTHRVIETEERPEPALLEAAANYINHEFVGLTLHDVRNAIVERMRQERIVYDALMARAMRLAQAGLDNLVPEETLHVQGAAYLVDELLGDTSEREHTLAMLRALLRMIEEKHQLVELLGRCLDTTGLTVVIGSEHGAADLHGFSLVASTFSDGDKAGTVGVIGPRRMRYQRAISVVDSVSLTLSRTLDGQ